MNTLYARDNDALRVHPPQGAARLTTNGSNWLWAVTALMLLSYLVFFVLSMRPRHGERIFHYVFATALIVGALTYYAQASDLGWLVISQANNTRTWPTRQIFYAKYIYWVVSFPAAVIALGLLSTVSWASIAYNVVLCWVWVISYLVAAFTPTNYKWGFFAIGTVAWLVLAFGTFTDGRKAANRSGVGRDFTMLAAWSNLLWLNYMIAWVISDGVNRIGITQMFIYFGILDVLHVPVMAIATLVLSRRWDYGRLNLHFTQYGRVRHDGHGVFPEKHHSPGRTHGTAAAPTTTVPSTTV
jgi:bacteriorhodopsin